MRAKSLKRWPNITSTNPTLPFTKWFSNKLYVHEKWIWNLVKSVKISHNTHRPYSWLAVIICWTAQNGQYNNLLFIISIQSKCTSSILLNGRAIFSRYAFFLQNCPVIFVIAHVTKPLKEIAEEVPVNKPAKEIIPNTLIWHTNWNRQQWYVKLVAENRSC